MPRVRGDAVLLLAKGWSAGRVVRRIGWNQRTVARWGQIAKKRGHGAISTRSSRPKRSPRAIVRAIVSKRTESTVVGKSRISLRDFRAAISNYLPYYNTKRLHMGINYQTPYEVMQRC